MPRGFQEEEGKVLKLERSLYGLHQTQRNFFENLKTNLLKVGFTQSSAHPFLFISYQVFCLVYVDDTLLYSPDTTKIDKTLGRLRKLEINLNVEDYVAGFSGRSNQAT